jgi:arylamine N-acetyltransferase
LDPDDLFYKLVERGFGGYCMENTNLFGTVLRSLGYRLYTTAARVNEGFIGRVDSGEYWGW